jgi:predicted phosphohydrolase
MRVQVLSDLHLEFGGLEFDFNGIDLLVLAGDVNIGEKGLLWIKEKVSKIPVIYVLGNHEYYKSSYPKLLNKLLQSSLGTNIHVLEKASVDIEGIRFHGTTLWTNFELFGDPKVAGYACQQKMNDYKQIRLDPSYSKLRSIDTHIFHYRSLNWLRESLLNSEAKKNVVITHHAPSPRSIPKKYKDDIISAAYAFDYFVDKTRIICNPQGYIHEPYNGFNSKLVLEVSA